jgi:hypothetical protein
MDNNDVIERDELLHDKESALCLFRRAAACVTETGKLVSYIPKSASCIK